MQKLILVFTLLISLSGFSQNIIKGTVKDEGGVGLPGVRISVENSTYGVPTNMKGAYFLEVPNSDTVIVKYQMIGFDSYVDTLIFNSSTVVNNITLQEKSTSLNTVEIYADKRDIAKEVIGKVMDNKKAMRNQFEAYQCETYIKTGLEKEKRFGGNSGVKISMGSPGGGSGRSKMNFIESNSITRYKQRGVYKETVLAHHDYAEKSNSSVTVAADFSDPNAILPTQVIEYNPYIFFEKVEDGDFDLYQNLVTLPKVSSKPLVSPLAVNAFINYKYVLNSIFFEDGQKIYDISVEPRFKEAPLFSGNLFIVDSLWIIKSMDLTVNPGVMNYFKDFRIIQDYKQFGDVWMPQRREFIYTINDGSNVVLANTRVNHSNYNFNPKFDSKTFKNVLMSYEEDAFDKDSAYWVDIRPIKLKPEELAYIHEQDSIERLLNSNAYVDSVNAEYNKLRFWDFILSGVGFRSREKNQEIYINPLISQIQPFGIGGYRHRLGGSYSKEFNNAQKIMVNGDIDYGFRNKDVKGRLGLEYTYLPCHFGSFKISGGDVYDFVTLDQSISNFLSRGNYVRKTFFQIGQRFEIVNGLYGQVLYDYSTRRDISDVEYAPWAQNLIESGFWQLPQPYETYTVSIFEFNFLYRFKQKYILKGNKKLIVGTEFPELRFKYKKGIPNMFGSDVDFDFVEIGASDKVTFGTMGVLKLDVEAGTFFGDNVDQVQFIEQKFFRGSDLFFFSNPLGTMQLLDSTFNTARPYFQAFAIHHFNGAIMNKIPLINRLRLELVAGASVLLIEEEDYAHIEFYAGLERQFKIKQQLFKIGTYYVVRENNAASVNLNLKFGLDFFNSFTNSWSY